MAFDAHVNFGYSLIAVAPIPASSGTTFTITTGEGAIMPAVPFNVVVWPAGANPSTTNAEICRVTSKGTGDNWTVTRTQESSSARAIALGDQVANAITVKVLTDVEGTFIPGTTAPTTTGTQTAEPIPAGMGDLVTYHKNAALKTIQGMVAGQHGQRWTHYSKGAGQVDFAHLHASGTALGRCTLFATTGLTSMAAGSGVMVFQYDNGVSSGATANWNLISHEQGAWITPTFAAGTFTGVNALTWTVDSGDVITHAYRLVGRTLTVAWLLAGTSCGGTPDTLLKITLPVGFTAVKRTSGVQMIINNAAAAIAAYCEVPAGGAYLALGADMPATGNWAASVNASQVRGHLAFEVT